jgi:hypothetical protein
LVKIIKTAYKMSRLFLAFHETPDKRGTQFEKHCTRVSSCGEKEKKKKKKKPGNDNS